MPAKNDGHRRDRRDWEIARHRSYNTDRDGRVIKGRGNMVYSASNFRRSRSRTPPHWKKELVRLKPLNPKTDDKYEEYKDTSSRYTSSRHLARDISQKCEKLNSELISDTSGSEDCSSPERVNRIQSCVYRVDHSQKIQRDRTKTPEKESGKQKSLIPGKISDLEEKCRSRSQS